MRTFIIALACAALFSVPAHAQVKVPSQVSTAFTAKFQAASNVNWDMEDDNTYEAEFEMNGREMSALFDRKGTWLETETAIDTDALPKAVLTAISTSYSGYELEEAQQVEDSKGATTYEVELSKGDESVEVVFAADGRVLKRQVEKDDEQDEMDED